MLEAACRALHGAARVVICSGFCVPTPAGPTPETDGPTGAHALALALTALGSDCRTVTAPHCARVFQALGSQPLDLLRLDGDAAREAAEYLSAHGPSHLVFIERPGRNASGRYTNMRGEPLSGVVPLDELLLAAPAAGVATIAVGDGGNEAGLGSLREAVATAVPHGERIATVVPAELPVVSGVSTWGAWGIVAGLSLLAGRDLLPTTAQARADLEAIVAAGAVDGPSGEPNAILDGLPWETSAGVLEELRRLVVVCDSTQGRGDAGTQGGGGL